MEELFENIKSEYSLPAVVVFVVSLLYLIVTFMIISVPGSNMTGTLRDIAQGVVITFFYGVPLVIVMAVISIVHIWMSQKKGILISALAMVLSMQYVLWLFANLNNWEIGPMLNALLSLK